MSGVSAGFESEWIGNNDEMFVGATTKLLEVLIDQRGRNPFASPDECLHRLTNMIVFVAGFEC